MGKYVYLYYDSSDGAESGDNEAWGKWFEKLGDKIVDAGNPFNPAGQAVHQGGVMPVKDNPATGYSIVNAESMEEATELAKDCPLLAAKDSAVCVYEALPM
jgi:hypothetical protein